MMEFSNAASLENQGLATYRRLMLKGVFSISQLVLTSASQIKALRQTKPSEKHYIRPERRYELPVYDADMPHRVSDARYLRPTRTCNCRAPEVIAVANHLGAFEKTDVEFAEAAFSFAKEMTTLEIRPIQPVEETLRLGTGTCFELITLFIALCRAVGIPARYKIFSTNMIQAWRDSTIGADPLASKWYDALDNFLFEGEGEAFVDGEWRVAHVGPTAERQAASGIPVTRFGEDSLGVWFTAKPGTIMYLESLPRGIITGSKLLHRISPASMERINISVLEQIEKGSKIIEEAGGVEVYDKRARAAAEVNPPVLETA